MPLADLLLDPSPHPEKKCQGVHGISSPHSMLTSFYKEMMICYPQHLAHHPQNRKTGFTRLSDHTNYNQLSSTYYTLLSPHSTLVTNHTVKTVRVGHLFFYASSQQLIHTQHNTQNTYFKRLCLCRSLLTPRVMKIPYYYTQKRRGDLKMTKAALP